MKQMNVITVFVIMVMLGVAESTDDKDLTGCSVSLNEYIFNLQTLKHSNA